VRGSPDLLILVNLINLKIYLRFFADENFLGCARLVEFLQLILAFWLAAKIFLLAKNVLVILFQSDVT